MPYIAKAFGCFYGRLPLQRLLHNYIRGVCHDRLRLGSGCYRDEAAVAIAELYADIRATAQVPIVSLIWRYLVTVPGAPAWMWGAVRLLYASGAVASAAMTYHLDLEGVALPAWAPAALSAAGLDGEAQR